jgi:hypothetical protein
VRRSMLSTPRSPARVTPHSAWSLTVQALWDTIEALVQVSRAYLTRKHAAGVKLQAARHGQRRVIAW